MTRDYLTAADIIGIHDILLKRYGGAEGVRDMGAIEATVFRPQCGYYSDIIQEACALLESLLIDHPFVDGNKRMAFAASDIFLRINGIHMKAENAEMHRRILTWLAADSNERLLLMEQDLRDFTADESIS